MEMRIISPDEIYQTITAETGTLITGSDFIAMNYGRQYGEDHLDHHRTILISGTSRSYMSTTQGNLFPRETYFQRYAPNISMKKISNAPDFISVRTEMTLDEVVRVLRRNGMYIPEEPPELEITDDDPTSP